jgi:hypothetical protein
MSAASCVSRLFFAASLLSLVGCAHTLSPAIEARPAIIPVRDRLPLRAAVVVTDDEMGRYKGSFSIGPHVYDFDLDLVSAARDALVLSLTQAVERVTVLRTLPPSGAYHVILAPKLAERTLDGWTDWGRMGIGLKFAVNGTLNVLDGTGKDLVAFRAIGEGTSTGGSTNEVDRLIAPLVSQALTNLVRKWGEQLATSQELEQYASRIRPAIALQSGGLPRPSSTAEIAISFSYPADSARILDETITVAGLVSAARPVRRVELVVNGRAVPVSRDVRVQQADVQSHPFNAQVELRAGENVIVVTAIDTSGNAAQAARTVFREGAQPAPGATTTLGAGERWAVVIGIDQYRDPSIAALRYASADAEAVFQFLTTRGGVKPANARLLLNRDASQRNIRQVLGDFLRQKALRDDDVIIYYAGHGTTEPDQSAEGGVAKYLVPWDADPLSLFSTAIPMEEIDRVFGRISARKILMIQDTCFSGGAGGRTFLAKGLTVRSTTLTDRFLQDLSQKEGRMILTASDVNQVSQEDPVLGHGIFTHYLLEALGGAGDLDGDGAVTVREIHLYLQRKVHERSRGVQTPQLYNVGDMVLIRK